MQTALQRATPATIAPSSGASTGATAPSPPTTPPEVDIPLALGMAMLGAATLVAASVAREHALSMEAGMDGCVVVGPVAVLLALLEGVRWRRAVTVLAPVFAVQLVGCFRYGVSPPVVMGAEAVVIGALGALSELGQRRRSPGARRAALRS